MQMPQSSATHNSRNYTYDHKIYLTGNNGVKFQVKENIFRVYPFLKVFDNKLIFIIQKI